MRYVNDWSEEEALQVWSLWLLPTGRVSRLSFVMRYLLPGSAIVAIGLSLLDPDATFGGINGLGAILFVAGCYVIFIKGGVRRLHDLNLSGWWMALVLGAFWALGTAEEPSATLILVAWILLPIIVLAPLVFVRGTAGPNRRGPDPLAQKS